MAIRYYKTQYKGSIPAIKNKWFLRLKTDDIYDIDKIAAHMASHSTAYTEGEISGMLKDLINCIQELVLDGKQVKLANLALFKLGINCKGVDDPNNATTQNIRKIRILARGTGKLSTQQLKQKAHFKELDEYSV